MDLIKNSLPFLNLLLIVIIPIVYFLGKSYLQSHLSESAKSNIQKRDIEEITKKIESVKSDIQKKDIEEITRKIESVKAIYSKDNEIIRHQLDQLLSLKTQHRNEEREALKKFYSAYIHWIYLLQGVNLADYNFPNIEELLTKKLSLNDFFYNIHVERANVLLIVNNDNIVSMTYKLIQHLISYKAFIEDNLLKLQFLLTQNKDLIDEFIKLDYHNPSQRTLMHAKAEDEKNLKKEIESLKKDFQDNRTPEFLKCRYISDEFATLTKTYLTSINN